MKIRTKLKLLITVYTFLPVLFIGLISIESPVFYHHDFQKALALGTVTAIFMILSGHFFGLHWLLTRQLQEVKRYCINIRKGNYTPANLPGEPSDPDDENELIALMRHMNWMTNQIKNREIRLKNVVDSLETSNQELESANIRIEEARAELWGEMALARKIQIALLPSKPVLSGFEIAASLDSVNEVGGDYYDIISLKGHDWIIVGDVSGHGVPAGLIMMMAQTAVHTALNENPGMLPSHLLTAINKTLIRNIKMLGEYKYMTMTALHMEDDGNISFAGLHQDFMIYRSSTGAVEEIKTRGIWLGVMDDISEVQPVDHCKLNHGDCLLLFTDGITESKDRHGLMFGYERLLEILRTYGDKSAKYIHEKIMDNLHSYEHLDDRTLLILKRLDDPKLLSYNNDICVHGKTTDE